MAATKLQANWTAVQHGSTTITRVSNVSFDYGGSISMYSGDDNVFDVVAVNLMNKPKATVTSEDPAALIGLGIGAVGTFTATHKDAKAAVGGAIVYTMLNSVVENVSAGGAHAQFGSGSLSLVAYSSDGSTPPLSIARS